MTRWSSVLRQRSTIGVPTITMEGDANGAPLIDPAVYAKKFAGEYKHRNVAVGIGHNLSQEAPKALRGNPYRMRRLPEV
jgi:hypothetical protein